jgi:hypothetical protein
MNIRKLFLYLTIASVAISALIGIVVILFGNLGELETKVLLTTLTVTVTSILGLACGAYYESGRGRTLPIAGIAMSLLTGLLWLIVIWSTFSPENAVFMKSVMTVTLISAACSHLSLLSLARLNDRFHWVRIAAAVLVWITAAIILAMIWGDLQAYENLIGRILGVLGILIAAVTILTPVLHRLSSSDAAADIDAEIAKLRERIAELEARKAAITPAA